MHICKENQQLICYCQKIQAHMNSIIYTSLKQGAKLTNEGSQPN